MFGSKIKKVSLFSLVAVLSFGTFVPASQSAPSKKKIRSEIYKIKKNEKKIEDYKKKADELKKKEEKITKDLVGIQQNKEKAKKKLVEAHKEFEQAHKKVEETTKKLDHAEEAWEDRLQEARSRLRRMYKTRYYSQVNSLAESSSTDAFIRKVTYYKYLAHKDKAALDELEQNKKNLEQLQYKLMEQRQHITRKAHEQQAAKTALEQVERKEKAERDKIRKERQAYEKAMRALERESRRITAELKRLLEGRTNTRNVQLGTGRFTHPVQGYPMTSRFGYRVHPIFRTRRLHTGMDYGAPAGVHIRAADSGVVISAGWRGGYGKAVLIDHGKGIVTLYAHSSAYYVRAGQRVKKGQVIAAVGSTGYSTGPHLHFEVRRNGAPINPASFL